MAKVTEEISIDAKCREIWPFLVEPGKLVLWRTDIDKMEFTDQEKRGVGSSYYIEKEIKNKKRRFNCTIDGLENGRRISFSGEAKGFARVKADYVLDPENGGCRFTIEESVEMLKAGPFATLFDRFFIQRGLSRTIEGFLVNLKSAIEG